MALIDFNKLKEKSTEALNSTSQFLGNAKDKTMELTNSTIHALLKGIDLNGLLSKVDEYQQKTGKDASKLIDFINNLINKYRVDFVDDSKVKGTLNHLFYATFQVVP